MAVFSGNMGARPEGLKPPARCYHPLTQGKIECCHRSMKDLILLDNHYAPAELTETIRAWWTITITSGITRSSTM